MVVNVGEAAALQGQHRGLQSAMYVQMAYGMTRS